MPKYVIERELPGAGKLSKEQLQAISQKSCGVLNNLGPQIQWIESFVTDDKIYCIYRAPNEAMVREHASQGGFPANKVSEVRTIIDRQYRGVLENRDRVKLMKDGRSATRSAAMREPDREAPPPM